MMMVVMIMIVIMMIMSRSVNDGFDNYDTNDDGGNADNDDGSSDYDGDSTACSLLSSSQGTSTNGPSSGRVPVIDTRERAPDKGTFA